LTRWIPGGAEEEAALLQTLGLHSVEELFADVPRRVRIGRLGLGAGLDEPELVRAVDKILDRNRPYSKFANFIGGRIQPASLPAAVDAILSRSELYTSYTPYQPEASQGILQALFEFQSLWVELTGLDYANASLYDGATAAGEALLLSRRIHEGRRFLIPASLPWEEKSVLRSYAEGSGTAVVELPFDARSGRLQLDGIRAEVARGDVCGVLADVPNGFGVVDETLLDLKAAIGEVPLVVVADPLALSVLEPPGSWGADIVVGEGQAFGMAPSFGGPLLGLFAGRREHLRLAPGRIVGATVDAEGKRAFTLTLQTREQHIRRSRATSNICTNQSLLAVAFVVYASLVGPRGLAQLQSQLAERARTLASALSAVDGLEAPKFDAPYLGSFTVGMRRGTVTAFLDRLRRRRILGGAPLADPMPGASPLGGEWFLTAPNVGTTEKEIQKFASAARAALPADRGTP
jgi:glycine cleavage system P protein (glycine dehydrogenase) subunit 1